MASRHVDSPTNAYVKELARLKERRARRRSGTFLVEGVREAERAVAAGLAPVALLLAPELVPEPGRVAALRAAAQERGAEVVTFSAAAYARLSLREHPDGVTLLTRSAPRAPADVGLTPGALALVLDGLEKPGNLGALLRTADAVGLDALFLTGVGDDGGGTDLENPNVIRASMGSVFAVPTAVGRREAVAAALEAAGLELVATTPHAAEPLWDVDLTGGKALLLGSEHAGLSGWWLERAHRRVRVPMRAGLADSLNVSVTGAVVLYEALRQRS